MDLKVQLQDVLTRVSGLEMRERKCADEILNLSKENKDLMMKIEISEMRYTELKGKYESLERTFQENRSLLADNPQKENKSLKTVNKLKGKYDELERTVLELKEEAKSSKITKEQILQLEKTRKMEVPQTEASETEIPKKEILQGIEDKIDSFSSWKDTKYCEDNKRFAAVDEQIRKTKTKINQLEVNLAHTGESIFCAKINSIHLRPNEMKKITKYATYFRNSNGLFDAEAGILKPHEDGDYCLGWKFLQKEDVGVVSFLLAIDGVKGRIFLGSTKTSDQLCTGMLITPLTKLQRVWIEAKHMKGPSVTVTQGNFMGWLLNRRSLGSSDVACLQSELFGAVNNECSLL